MIFLRSFLACMIIVMGTFLMTSCKQNPTEETSEGSSTAQDTAYKVAVMLSPEDFEKGSNKNNAVIIDIRFPAEYEQGHIDGSVNMNFFDPNFKTNLLELNKNKKYYLYCKNDTNSEAAAEFLMKNDYPDVYVLEGGYQAWQKAQLE